jgi:hypothetical protein
MNEKNYGASVNSHDLKNLLKATYEPKKLNTNYEMNKSLSKGATKVFKQVDGDQVIISHRGTVGLLDWANNATYAIGGTKAYKNTSRYKHAAEIQKKAEKYGASNISTIGHSQGGLQAELLDKNTNEILTYNKATVPGIKNKIKANQTDINVDRDVVSHFQNKSKLNNVSIKSKSYNPLINHSIDKLLNDK